MAWDEFEQQKGRNVDAVLIDTMQNYLANKSFNRGKGTHEASASMSFVGNTKHPVPYMLENSHLFESVPTSSRVRSLTVCIYIIQDGKSRC